jgi:hypothetical protein
VSSYRAALAAAASAAVVVAALPAPTALADQPPAGWGPDVGAARAYATSRRGSISFAVAVPGGRLWGDRIRRTVPSASVLKAMLMVAYLNHPSVRRRALRASDLDLLSPMIRRSDNATATRVRAFVGARRLRKLARRAGMRRFIAAPTRSWGSSRIDAEDQARFFLDIDRRIVPRHRSVALKLLRRIVPSQRWGVGRVAPAGWELYFKGGWGSGTGAVDHQVALLRRAGTRVAVAVLTTDDGSHAYGKETLRGMFKRLLRGLAVSLR